MEIDIKKKLHHILTLRFNDRSRIPLHIKRQNSMTRPRPIPKQLIERHKIIHIFASHPGVCPYCQIQSTWLNLQSTHFDYCPKNPNQKKRMLPKLECPYCGKIGRGNAMMRCINGILISV